jgi:FKBP-type peptidyl-prolyl cis-trans isomerase
MRCLIDAHFGILIVMNRSIIVAIVLGVGIVGGLVALSAQSQSANNQSGQQQAQEASSSMEAAKLQIDDLVVGTGAEVQPGATVTVHYVGTLTDGRKFDASRDHGTEPVTFSLNGVIRGWQEGLVGMKVGGKRKLVIPGDMAYGSNPPPGSIITPNATLVFEVEMLDTK